MGLLRKLTAFRFTILYILAIPFTNWVLVVTPPVIMPDGTPFTVAVFIVGFVFIFRDFCQKEVGSLGALAAIGVAAVLTWFMATPALAVASIAAFLAGELADWLIYTLTKRPMPERVLYSSLASAPVDTAVFLLAANPILPGIFSWSGLVLYALGKILVAVAISYALDFKEKRGYAHG